MNRRTFLQLTVAAATLSPLERVSLWAQAGLPGTSVSTLRAVARVVLPASLGRTRVASVTDGFVAWIAGYRSGAVTQHGYGHPRIRRTADSPAARYTTQLGALEQAARSRGQSFAKLALEAQRTILDVALKDAGVETLPNQPNGRHVVSDLMAFYFQSSEANDECYHARIGRSKCRPLSYTTAKPRPLT